MGSTAAEIARQRFADLGLARVRDLVEQRLRGDEHPRDAISALRGLLVDEGLLQRVRIARGSQPLERGDLRTDDGPDGLRNPGTTALPSGQALASTFNRALARAYGEVVGSEARGEGFNSAAMREALRASGEIH